MNARGHCCDNAAIVSGKKSSVTRQIKNLNGTCPYTNCHGFDVQLAVGNMIKNKWSLCDMFDIMREISKLLKKPTERDTHMELVCMIAKNESKGIHTFCPAPWAVRGGLCSLS